MTAGPGTGTLPVMKKTISAAAVIATVAAAAVAHGQAAPTTIHLVDHSTGYVFNDVKPKQLPKKTSLGDTLTITGKLTGDRTGTDGLVCTIIKPGKSGAELCQGTAALGDGNLLFTGRLPENDAPVDLAVTGGTGAYANAKGIVHTKDGAHDTTVIDITLAG